MKRIRFQFCAVFLMFLCAGTFAFGQTDRATITGTVADPTGAMITGVPVLVTQTGTGTSYSGVTNQEGIYRIPGLPVGTYTLRASHPGFKDYVRTDLILVATQVLEFNIRMVVGSSTQTVTISGSAPLLEAATSSVSMTVEQSALRDLPLDATGGRDAMNLMLAVTPLTNTWQGGQAAGGGTENWDSFAGQVSMTNSVYIDGIESTAGMQGQINTPGLDALSEVQIITNPSDAEFGTGGGVELFQIKSGTSKFHGSAFEFLQNEDLNANSWANNYFFAQCAPSDAQCRAQNSRGRDRFNDYGFSAGGPIWKNHTFIFGDFEVYSYDNFQLVPNAVTVPTPKMLTGDFSELLTGGAQQGSIPGPSGGPWVNPCTGQPYQYGQIFDPETQKVVGGSTCATPFTGNIIPSARLSPVSQKVAALYTKYAAPTISSRIYNNFPTLAVSNPSDRKHTIDLKLDHTFSSRHHISAGLDGVGWRTLDAENSGLNYTQNNSPLSNDDWGTFLNATYRIIDAYTFTPNLLNTVGIGYAENQFKLAPQVPTNPADYGISGPTTPYFPRIVYDGQSGAVANGVNESDIGTYLSGYFNTYAYQYQDTAEWNKGRHSIKFGGTFKAQEMNSQWGSNLQEINFYGETGGPTDPGLTPYVGFAFANQMLGDVQSSSVQVDNATYPRQKQYALFFQDNYKATPRLTLNLGLRWDMTGRLHEKNGRLENFDLTAQNPLWAPYTGAWVFSKNSGTSFTTSEDYLQFGPHVGAAYRLTDKLVARASWGLFYVPPSTLNSAWGGVGAGYIATQTELSYPINQVTNSVPGSVAYNWSNYPGVNVLPPQDSTATVFPIFDIAMYTHPDYLHLGRTQNFYVGTEYAIKPNVVLDLSYIGNRGTNLTDTGRSLYRNSPLWSDYAPVLNSGHINDTISNPAEAAAAGVPYPYAGFSGPAYAAIAPLPQVVASGATFQVAGDPADSAVTAFNSFVAEVKARSYHGLYLDFSYTMSKQTGSQVMLSGWGNNWQDFAQNMDDWSDEKHWVQIFDQRHLAKGYATYLLPIGRGQKWLPRASMLLNTVVGGWELGYYGSYGSGSPMGPVVSPYQLPYFFNTPYSGDDRANLRPGLTPHSVQNHFSGHLDLGNLNDASNTDFNPNLFTSTSATAPFGNTPFTFNHWRWNPGIAHENMTLLKHFSLFPREGVQAILGAEFFDIFNRHYYGEPDQYMSDPTFGQVTSVSGYRYGQLSARIEW